MAAPSRVLSPHGGRGQRTRLSISARARRSVSRTRCWRGRPVGFAPQIDTAFCRSRPAVGVESPAKRSFPPMSWPVEPETRSLAHRTHLQSLPTGVTSHRSGSGRTVASGRVRWLRCSSRRLVRNYIRKAWSRIKPLVRSPSPAAETRLGTDWQPSLTACRQLRRAHLSPERHGQPKAVVAPTGFEPVFQP
jgi:hypothetical protein